MLECGKINNVVWFGVLANVQKYRTENKFCGDKNAIVVEWSDKRKQNKEREVDKG